MRLILCLIATSLLFPQAVAAQMRAQDGLARLDAGDVAGAVAIWTPLAARGDALAALNLGVLALGGQGGLSPAQADAFLQTAAMAGDGRAAALLGDLATDRQDWPKARDWFERAATAGEVRAQFMAGLLADQGLGGPADRARAEALYAQAATAGHAPAQLALGRLYLETARPEAAAPLLAQAAEAGLAQAQFDLGQLLANGQGVAADPAAARAWYLRAARAGYGRAMYNLALMQARGQGGVQSYRRALAWALLAQAAGADEGDLVSALREVMPPDHQQEAEALSQTCLGATEAACD